MRRRRLLSAIVELLNDVVDNKIVALAGDQCE